VVDNLDADAAIDDCAGLVGAPAMIILPLRQVRETC
jgi:hypothetical protein